jgi:Phage virion morphogenesis family
LTSPLSTEISDRQVSLLFRGLLSADFGKLRVQAGELLVKKNRERIDREIEPSGKPWSPFRSAAKRRTRLIDSVVSYVRGETVVVEVRHPAARFFHFGTKPHIIRPRTKKALYWIGAKHPVAKVNHPGTPPRKLLGFSAEDIQEVKDLARSLLLGR